MKKLEEQELISTKLVFVLIGIAYLFSVIARYWWVYKVGGIDSFHWNNQLMINTNDGYYWATSADAYLNGTHQYNPRVIEWYSQATTFFTVLGVKFLPFSLETVILYMPSVISSLIVIPIILVMRLYNLTLIGFFSALIASIAWSYYNRTMIGYYDSDMFSVLMATFILYFVIATVEKRKLEYALITGILMFLYPFFYDQGKSVVTAIVIMFIIYKVIFYTKERFSYEAIILMTIALIPLPFISYEVSIVIKIPLLIGLYFILKSEKFTKRISLKNFIILTTIIVIFGFYFSGLIPAILNKLSQYLSRGVDNTTEGLKYLQVIQTIREAGAIPFSLVAKRIIGSPLGLIVAFVGYLTLIFKYRSFILALPLFGIGLFAYWGGLRFTVYAVPIASISAVYLFYFISKSIFTKDKEKFAYVTTGLLSLAILWPNIKHLERYIPGTVFSKQEVEILDKLKSISSPKDYTLTWWDYGYPIWFYSNTNTIIDGGKHEHDNFIVSTILTSNSQLQAANLSRIAVETYIKSNYRTIADTLFENENPNEFLLKISSPSFVPPKKSVDVYIYLPFRMVGIFPTVNRFGNRNLVSGRVGKPALLAQFGLRGEDEDFIYFTNNFKISKKRGYIEMGNKKMAIHTFAITFYDKNRKLQKSIKTINPKAGIYLIYLSNYKKLLLLDKIMYNSLYIQLFALENYDKNLFEPVILSPYVKVFKLKR